MNKSPFRLSRFEYEDQHLYYLPKKLFQSIEAPQPTYLIGTRGSGKTTLLKALHWGERIQNGSLQTQLSGAPFGNQVIGLYAKLPELQLQSLDWWLKKEEDSIYGAITSFYLDLIFTELSVEALSGLISTGVIKPTPNEELLRVQEVYKAYFKRPGNDAPETLKMLESRIREARLAVEKAAQFKTPLRKFLKTTHIRQIGELGRRAATTLVSLCKGRSRKKWYFKMCFDECECLNERQQRVLNSLVRLSTWPSFPVVTYVSQPEDMVQTLIPKLTLQKADRQLINLDEMIDNDFAELASGVLSVRIAQYLRRAQFNFDLTRTLGKLSINVLLARILNESVRPEAKAWLQKAAALSKTEFYSDAVSHPDSELSPSGSAPPIYEAYLIETLRLTLPNPKSPNWVRRRQESREIRKKMVAAYLSLCRDIGADVRYASAEMVLQMSDKCMRDFLAQLDQIFNNANVSLQTFVLRTVPIDVQDVALKRASAEKRASLVKSGVQSPIESSRVIEGLSILTRLLQSSGVSNQHLQSSERGIFQLNSSDLLKPDSQATLKIIRDAGEAGFFKILSKDDGSLKFRINTSLAATYQFSYRGAYYPTHLSFQDVDSLRQASNSEDVSKAARKIATRLSHVDGTDTPLFKELEND